MTVRFLLVSGLILTGACTSHERPIKPTSTAQIDEPEAPEPEPEPEPKRVAQASIASVQMLEDCPDPVVEEAASAVPARPAQGARAAPMQRRAPGAVAHDAERGWSPPCTQSTMQLAFTGQGDLPGRVVIERISVIDPKKGRAMGSVQARRPQAWQADGSYGVWDEVIAPDTDVKASYSLSVPDWAKVERELGESSFGHMFVLEVELTIDGERQTVRSPEFPREEPHVIVT